MTHPSSSAHLIRRPFPRQDAELALVCFPHAGGSASAYHAWGRALPPDIEVWAIELPGRASRFSEAPFRHLAQAREAIAETLERAGLRERPHALFGHSMGGILAYEVAQALGPSPHLRHFFASGCHPPDLRTDDPPIGGLPDAQFLQALRDRYDGIPDEVLREKELLAMVLPVLRADMCMMESYRHEPGPALACPITVLTGVADQRATRSLLAGWERHTRAGFEMLSFAGGHFYLQSATSEVLRAVAGRTAPGP